MAYVSQEFKKEVAPVVKEILNRYGLKGTLSVRNHMAIGKSGQNVRLAARLTGWKIDVKPKSAVPSLNLDESNSNENYDNLFDGEDAFGDLN